MKVIEILNFNRELLKRLQASGIRLEDARYIDLYSDYTRLLDQGEKVSYVVAVLSEKYSVSERKVYALVKRFQSDCKTLAVRTGSLMPQGVPFPLIFREFQI